MGTLFIVATPIGNLEDITIRAIQTLFSVPVIACEDTRRTGMLLKLLEEKFSSMFPQDFYKREKPRLLSYYDDIEDRRIPEILSLLLNGTNVALVSDAGTPAVSDPGFKLIRACREQAVRVESIPGPSSVISALVSSGLPTDKFFFFGYPPKKPGNRERFLQNTKHSLEASKATAIFFESPHRLEKTLEALLATFGDMDIVVTKELTKVHEGVRKEKISVLLDHYKTHDPKGEFVVLLNLNEKLDR